MSPRWICSVILVRYAVIYHCKCQRRAKGGPPIRSVPNYTICLVIGTVHCKVSAGTTPSPSRVHHQLRRGLVHGAGAQWVSSFIFSATKTWPWPRSMEWPFSLRGMEDNRLRVGMSLCLVRSTPAGMGYFSWGAKTRSNPLCCVASDCSQWFLVGLGWWNLWALALNSSKFHSQGFWLCRSLWKSVDFKRPHNI